MLVRIVNSLFYYFVLMFKERLFENSQAWLRDIRQINHFMFHPIDMVERLLSVEKFPDTKVVFRIISPSL